jgi:hypothetical protein
MFRQKPSTDEPNRKRRSFCEQLKRVPKPHLDAKTASPSVCQGTTCSINAAPSSHSSLFSDNSFLSELLPTDFYEGMQAALEKGILLSFLCTLTEEVVTDLLEPRGYNEEQIQAINNALKALILIFGGISLGKAVAGPMLNTVFMNVFGMSKEKAGCLTIASVVGFDLLTNPFTVAKGLTVGLVVTGSLVTSFCTQFFYHKGKETVQQQGEALALMGALNHLPSPAI